MKTESSDLRVQSRGADVSETHTVSRMRGLSPNSPDSLSPVCLSRHSCRQDIAALPVFIGKTGFLGGKDALTSDILHENSPAGLNQGPRATFRFNAHQAFRLYHNLYKKASIFLVYSSEKSIIYNLLTIFPHPCLKFFRPHVFFLTFLLFYAIITPIQAL